MSQTQNGQDALTAEQKLVNFKDILSRCYEQARFSNIQPDEDTESILSLNKEQIRRLASYECGENAFILQKHSLFIQKDINEQSAIIKWCDDVITNLTHKKMPQYKAYSYEERRALAINDNSQCITVFGIRRLAEARVTALSYLANKLDLMSKTLLTLQEEKRRRERENG